MTPINEEIKELFINTIKAVTGCELRILGIWGDGSKKQAPDDVTKNDKVCETLAKVRLVQYELSQMLYSGSEEDIPLVALSCLDYLQVAERAVDELYLFAIQAKQGQMLLDTIDN